MTANNGNGKSFYWVLVSSIVVSYIIASTTWAFISQSRFASLEMKVNANSYRLLNLEEGRTTPMAAETRAEINAIKKDLEDLKNK